MINTSDIIKNYTKDTASSIIEVFYNELVSKEDQKLLELAFAKKIEQENLDNFLKDWDIEKYGEGKSLMLSYVMKTNPQLKFSNYEKPRLEGLLKYHRFRNLKLISHYNKIVKVLNQENIFPMILKGGAMKHIRPEFSRAMGDIDILILEEAEITKAREICKNLGYVEEIPDDHSIDLHLPNSEEGTVDIHRYIDLETNYDKSFSKDLFLRAKKEDVFGCEAFVPCFEDLLFLGMINLARNLNNKTSLQGILYSLFDFKYLSESKDFNWDLVLQNIVKTNTYAQALLAMKFINKIIPKTLPEYLLNNKTINKKFNRHCDYIIFHHFYFNDFRKICKKLSIKKAVKSLENMKDYVSKKPKYFLLKRIIRKNHILIKIFLMLNSRKQRES
ncbi:MAG: nucleotidyltransferase family protein [Rickettsiales bacterium]|nr:nucleotidyltransferase family protein [Rickettsiales bacterium]